MNSHSHINFPFPFPTRHLESLYQEALVLKASSKSKPDELIKLDSWYQNELPKLLASREPDKHLLHEELVGVIKWKLAVRKYTLKNKLYIFMPATCDSPSKDSTLNPSHGENHFRPI